MTLPDAVRLRTALAALSLLAVAGCASLQQPAEAPAPDPTPAGWTAAAAGGEATDLSAWWARFGDPALAPLVEQALQANTSVAAALARLRQARAQRTLAEADLAPRVTGSGSAQASTDRGPGDQRAVPRRPGRRLGDRPLGRRRRRRAGRRGRRAAPAR